LPYRANEESTNKRRRSSSSDNEPFEEEFSLGFPQAQPRDDYIYPDLRSASQSTDYSLPTQSDQPNNASNISVSLIGYTFNKLN